MSDTTWYSRQRGLRLCEAVLARLDEIDKDDFPNDTPKKFIKLLEGFAKSILEKIKLAANGDVIRSLSDHAIYLGKMLAYVEHAVTTKNPRGITYIVDFINDGLKAERMLLVSPDSGYNYSIDPLDDMLSELLDASIDTRVEVIDPSACDQQIESGIKAIFFPNLERENILNHVMFGHELGHQVADDFLDLELEEDNKKQAKQHKKANKQRANQYAEPYNKELALLMLKVNSKPSKKMGENSNRVNEIVEIRKRGLEELLSDAVCAMIFGTSALFALHDIMLLDDDFDRLPRREYGFYPPNRYRLRNIYNILETRGVNSSLRDAVKANPKSEPLKQMVRHLDLIKKETEISQDKKLIQSDFIVQEAYKWLENSLDRSIEFVSEKVKLLRLNNDFIGEQLPELVYRIDNKLPPSELGRYPDTKIADWRMALLAGWAFKVSPDKECTELDINNLVMEAIEYIMISNKYQQYLEGEDVSSGP